MIKQLQTLQQTISSQINQSDTVDQLDQIRIQVLGKNGQLTDILKQISTLSNQEKPIVGKQANIIKIELQKQIETKQKHLQEKELSDQLNKDQIDITLPGLKPQIGHKHPIEQTTETICSFFQAKGFEIKQGPQVETDYYNFDALNIAKDHPARDMHDTFYIDNNHLLRTHTSPVQIHTMEKEKPPIKILAPGKVYRCDSDATHSPVFHQVEGLYVNKDVSFAQLKGTLNEFLHHLFGDKKIRYRPSYFPFTEPSVEIDIEFIDANGKKKWLEIMGAGMVHPNVFQKVNYSKEITGFAFGIGVERVAMLRYDITDIRLFFENDKRFLKQF